VVPGQIITAAKYQQLNDIIKAESERRIDSSFSAIDPNPPSSPGALDADNIDADQYNKLAQSLTGVLTGSSIGLITQMAAGLTTGPHNDYGSGYIFTSSPTGSGLFGNGSNTTAGVQVRAPIAPTIDVPTVPGTDNNTNIGMVMQAYKTQNVNGFNELIDSLIFAGQQCYCNCNYCSCNCNFCTCDCNFACTCNCNYSDETLKINIEVL